LRVAAREETTGAEARVEVKPSYGLSDEQIEQMLLDSYEHAEDDLKKRLITEARVEAERILGALAGALAADGALLTADERDAIDRAAEALRAALAGSDHRKIRALTETLDHASKPFAEKRMNRGIERALGGRDVGEIEKKVEHAEGTEHHGR
jgi:molecular chaperone HscA